MTVNSNYDFLTGIEKQLEDTFLEFMDLSEKFVEDIKNGEMDEDLLDIKLENSIVSILEKNGLTKEHFEQFSRYILWRTTEGYYLTPECDVEYNPNLQSTFLEFEIRNSMDTVQ
jgi:hypothetical protein